jgi:hypothetical protein
MNQKIIDTVKNAVEGALKEDPDLLKQFHDIVDEHLKDVDFKTVIGNGEADKFNMKHYVAVAIASGIALASGVAIPSQYLTVVIEMLLGVFI